MEEELQEQDFLDRCFQEMLDEEDQDWFIPSRDLPPAMGQLQQQLNGLSVSDDHDSEDILVRATCGHTWDIVKRIWDLELQTSLGALQPWARLGASEPVSSPIPQARIGGRAKDALHHVKRCENSIVTAAPALSFPSGLFKVELGLRVGIGTQRRFGFKLAFALVVLSLYCSSNLYL